MLTKKSNISYIYLLDFTKFMNHFNVININSLIIKSVLITIARLIK